VLGLAVQAAVTVTFAAHKRGLHQQPGAAHAGQIICVDIDAPSPVSAAAAVELVDVARGIERRPDDWHKGDSGHVLVFGGSKGMTGAALLAALGALRVGAGLATIATDREARTALDQKVIEIMTAELADDPQAAIERAIELAKDKAVAVLGPGAGLDDRARTLVRELAVRLPIPTIVDADALTALSDAPERLRDAVAPRVITPHSGEAGRLLRMSTSAVQADRFAAADALARRTGAIAVLKGARTIVASPDGQQSVCDRGTPALAVAGTGDVLAGTIAGVQAGSRFAPSALSVGCSVVLHALAGEIAAKSDRGLLAREVADALPLALEACRAHLPT